MLVADAQADSPAVRAGIVAGDVITGLNGTAIKDARSLAQAVAALTPGTSVKVDLVHGGMAKSVSQIFSKVSSTLSQASAS